jgi:hypothetical protein
VVSHSDSGDARELIQELLMDLGAYYRRSWSDLAQPYTPTGQRRHPLDEFFEHLTALHPLDGYGAESDQELALLLQVPTRELIDTIGGRWFRPRDYRVADTSRIWFLSGEPMQVTIGIGPHDLVVGTPTLQWAITPSLVMEERTAQLPRELSPEVAEAATRAQEIRRAQFTYCRTCRAFTPPEHGGSTCHGCMQTIGGVVF